MEYISVVQFAEKYGISERTARNYCAEGKRAGENPIWTSLAQNPGQASQEVY